MQIEDKKPNLFVLGAPKCGTTSIIHYLDQHPEIFMSTVKEPHFFNFDSERRYFHNLEKYLHLFKDAKITHKYLGEGSVWYLYSKVAIEEILRFNPSAKFVIMLRNPVDMFFSLHQELLYGGSENERSPVKAWNLQKIRALGKNIPLGCKDSRILQYGDACKLGNLSLKASQSIPRNQIFFILLDDLKSDADKTFNGLLRFLDLKEIHLKSYKVVNAKKVRKSQLLARFFIKVNYLKNKAGIKRGFGIASAINRYNVSHGTSLVNIERDELSLELKSYFDNDIDTLEKVIGRDLSNWKF